MRAVLVQIPPTYNDTNFPITTENSEILRIYFSLVIRAATCVRGGKLLEFARGWRASVLLVRSSASYFVSFGAV